LDFNTKGGASPENDSGLSFSLLRWKPGNRNVFQQDDSPVGNHVLPYGGKSVPGESRDAFPYYPGKLHRLIFILLLVPRSLGMRIYFEKHEPSRKTPQCLTFPQKNAAFPGGIPFYHDCVCRRSASWIP
jgi:hypothetical protein